MYHRGPTRLRDENQCVKMDSINLTYAETTSKATLTSSKQTFNKQGNQQMFNINTTNDSKHEKENSRPNAKLNVPRTSHTTFQQTQHFKETNTGGCKKKNKNLEPGRSRSCNALQNYDHCPNLSAKNTVELINPHSAQGGYMPVQNNNYEEPDLHLRENSLTTVSGSTRNGNTEESIVPCASTSHEPRNTNFLDQDQARDEPENSFTPAPNVLVTHARKQNQKKFDFVILHSDDDELGAIKFIEVLKQICNKDPQISPPVAVQMFDHPGQTAFAALQTLYETSINILIFVTKNLEKDLVIQRETDILIQHGLKENNGKENRVIPVFATPSRGIPCLDVLDGFNYYQYKQCDSSSLHQKRFEERIRDHVKKIRSMSGGLWKPDVPRV